MSSPVVNRRQLFQTAAVSAGAAGLALATPHTSYGADEYRIQNSNIRQSVVAWCFKPMTVADLAKHAQRLGYLSVELCPAGEWPMLKELGLTCAIGSSHGFAKGFAHTEEHDECIAKLREQLDLAAAHGVPSVITFSGFRRGLSTDEGVKNMVAGLKKIVGYAEEKNVTLCLEHLNSRVPIEMKGHPDYFCDDMELTVDIIKQVGSPRLKVLFDIYHVQIMHGDVITRLLQHQEYIGHIHTAGNPGRAELDDTQEIYYPPIMKKLVEIGYDDYVGHEFIPARDPLAGLKQAVQLCDV